MVAGGKEMRPIYSTLRSVAIRCKGTSPLCGCVSSIICASKAIPIQVACGQQGRNRS